MEGSRDMTFERNFSLLIYGWQQLWRENVVFKIISCTARIFILLIKRNLMIYLLFYVQLKFALDYRFLKNIATTSLVDLDDICARKKRRIKYRLDRICVPYSYIYAIYFLNLCADEYGKD